MDVNQSERNLQAQLGSDSLVASLAHEINNPLDALLNLLYLLESEDTLTESGRHYLALAKEELHRISQITHGAMKQFRGPAGPQDTNVPRLLKTVIEFYKSRLEAQGICVDARYCLGEDLPVDPGSLRQVFSNLLLNAAYAMPQGGIMHARVAKAHEWSGLNRHGLRVTFADNGCGISADDLPKVTDAFFTTKGTGGTGLGLGSREGNGREMPRRPPREKQHGTRTKRKRFCDLLAR